MEKPKADRSITFEFSIIIFWIFKRIHSMQIFCALFMVISSHDTLNSEPLYIRSSWQAALIIRHVIQTHKRSTIENNTTEFNEIIQKFNGTQCNGTQCIKPKNVIRDGGPNFSCENIPDCTILSVEAENSSHNIAEENDNKTKNWLKIHEIYFN